MTVLDDLSKVRLSFHAGGVMVRRDASCGEIAEALRDPDIVEPQGDARRFVKGSLVVVLADDGTIVTLLLRASETWSDTDCHTAWRSTT